MFPTNPLRLVSVLSPNPLFTNSPPPHLLHGSPPQPLKTSIHVALNTELTLSKTDLPAIASSSLLPPHHPRGSIVSSKMGDTAPPQAPTGGLGGAPGAGLLGGGSVTPRVHSAIVERLRARIAVCRQHHLSCEGRYERGRAESSDRERESTLQLLSLVQHGQGARKAGKHTKATATAATTTAPPPPPAAPPTASQATATAAPPPPPDYHHHHQQHLLNSSNNGGGGGIDGEQQSQASTPGDQRNSALIAVRHLVFS